MNPGTELRMDFPVNPRYHPKSMEPYFGYDNLARYQIRVEWALLEALAAIGIIPQTEAVLLTEELKLALLEKITTTLQDGREKVTKHDIRALVQLIQEDVPEELKRWIHFVATSYDIIDTARILAYKEAFYGATFPALLSLIETLSDKAEEFAFHVQIGRTHKQHALPITVGFWIATLLDRFLDSAENLVAAESKLTAKFSGAVGAYNAQALFGLDARAQENFGMTFEELVLSRLGLTPARISTQILPPNALARFLHEYVLLAGNFGQLGRDGRNLQSTEVAEIMEEFGEKQVGSSTMAHKRNPISFESAEGMHDKVCSLYRDVLDCLISDYQRDLVGSTQMRDFPAIVILCQHQLERLNNTVSKMSVDEAALQRNFRFSQDKIMAEPIYLALQFYGYRGDAHHLVNHVLMPKMKRREGSSLLVELATLHDEDNEAKEVFKKMPREVVAILGDPAAYTGKAGVKTMEVVQAGRAFLEKYK